MNLSPERKAFLLSLHLTRSDIQFLYSQAFEIPHEGRMTLCELPEEILIFILEYIHDPISLACISRLNKKFNRILKDNLLWKTICKFKEFSFIHASVSSPYPPSPSLSQNSTALVAGNHIVSLSVSHHRPSSSHRRRKSLGEHFHRSHYGLNHSEMLGGSSWREVFIQNHRTMLNWRRGSYVLKPVEPVIGHLCMNFNDKMALSVSSGQHARVFSLENGTSALSMTIPDISCARLCEDAFMITANGNNVNVWRISDSQLHLRLQGHIQQVGSLHHFGIFIASGSEDCTMRIWNRNTGECKYIFSSSGQPVCSVNISDRFAACGDASGIIRLWSLIDGAPIRTVSQHSGAVFCLAMDSTSIASGGEDSIVALNIINEAPSSNIGAGESSHSKKESKLLLNGHTQSVLTVQFDKEKIISGSSDRQIKVWDRKTGYCMYTLSGHFGPVWSIYFNKSKLISSSFDSRLLVWDFCSDAIPKARPIFTGGNDNHVDINFERNQ